MTEKDISFMAPMPQDLCATLKQQGLVHRWGIRLLDLLIAAVGLILSLPLFLVLPVLIKLDSPGRVFFLQRRLGQGGRPFLIIKFRTMLNNQNKGRWTLRNDPRITKVGKFLRKSHLDEIPQLINVILGQLSVVGPRPYTQEVFEQLCLVSPDISFRLYLKPGLTGWAQLVGSKADGLEQHIEILNNERRYLDSPLTVGRYLHLVGCTMRYFFSKQFVAKSEEARACPPGLTGRVRLSSSGFKVLHPGEGQVPLP
jgi:lipopolysaccharide/colanic/teichoic acid biosynthesis glycosyltransferase